MFHRFIGKTQPDPNCLCCVLSTAQVCLQEAKLQHTACTLLSKYNLQACESRAQACKRLGACTELFLRTFHPQACTGRQAPQVGDTRLWEDATSCLYPAALTGWLCLSLGKIPWQETGVVLAKRLCEWEEGPRGFVNRMGRFCSACRWGRVSSIPKKYWYVWILLERPCFLD